MIDKDVYDWSWMRNKKKSSIGQRLAKRQKKRIKCWWERKGQSKIMWRKSYSAKNKCRVQEEELRSRL